ncbi:MAG: S1 RNA-binding domain-containing protein, partial [Fluviibacter sp.]
QDGLVHISALSNTFVKDPHEVVKAGQVVRVKVLEVDLPRKRIALTMRLSDEAAPPRERHDAPGSNRHQQRPRDNAPHKAPRQQAAPMNNAMANAFAKLRK